MSDSEDFGYNDPDLRVQNSGELHSRTVGSPLPVGAGPQPQSQCNPHSIAPPPPGRSLGNSAVTDSQFDQHPSIQRAISTLCMALPFVQRLLPLFESNLAATASTGLAPHPQTPPLPPVNLEPIEDSLAELQTQQHDLRSQIQDQNSSLKRVEDQLEMVRDATDRNTLEQQELLEDLKGFGNKINTLTFFALGLLVVSILLNLIMFLHIRRVLP